MENYGFMRQLLLISTLLCAVIGWQPHLYADESASNVSAVNINTASASEIATALNGIGEKRAAAIVAYRDKHGAFESIESITQVKGVGEKVVEKNKDSIRL